MAVPGANLDFSNSARLWQMFLRKMGFKPTELHRKSPTMANMAADAGTVTGRSIAICAKYSAATAPTTNTAADAPSGLGDICIHVKATVTGKTLLTDYDVYRCSAYTNTTTFTWTQIL